MRKIKSEYENPIDNVILNLCEEICPILKRYNFTPNMITTISLFFGILSVYYLYLYKIGLFAIFFMLSYFFDCVDGHYARKYDMVTKFGDTYDHIKDLVVYLSVIFVLLIRFRIRTKDKILAITFLIVIMVLCQMHLGCQEKIYDKDESDTLHFMRNFCGKDAEKNILYTKYFGCGTFVLLSISLIFYLDRVRKK